MEIAGPSIRRADLDEFTEAHRRLVAAAAAGRAGRTHHSWSHVGHSEAFGQTLVPILGEIGTDPGEPAMMPIHRPQQTTSSTSDTSKPVWLRGVSRYCEDVMHSPFCVDRPNW